LTASARPADLIDSYLQRLRDELIDVSPQRRDEIVDEIRRHIEDQGGGAAGQSNAAVMNVLDRLGDPAEIAAEARGGKAPADRTAIPHRSRLGTFDMLALALLILAWPVGAVLLWISKAWSARDKVIATLIPPGGYPGVLLIMSTFRWIKLAADGGPAWLKIATGAALFTVSLLLIVAPIGTCIYLATRTHPRRTAPADE
jgi:hypothetical protein